MANKKKFVIQNEMMAARPSGCQEWKINSKTTCLRHYRVGKESRPNNQVDSLGNAGGGVVTHEDGPKPSLQLEEKNTNRG